MKSRILKPVLPFLAAFNRTDQEDPLKTWRYIIEVDNFARFGFASMKGLSAETEVVKYAEGGSSTDQKSPGRTTFADVTLERGVILLAGQGSMDMLNWYNQVYDASTQSTPTTPAGSSGTFRRSIDVVMFDKTGAERLRWRLSEAWPKGSVPFPDLEAMSSNNVLEKLTIVHEGYRLVTSTAGL
jgi:phage tail-like protein